jgi:hypothetical protein
MSAGVRSICNVAVVFALASAAMGPASSQPSGPFSAMAGAWSGSGRITLDDGSTERLRCRANYAVAGEGASLRQTLRCAGDSYKFELESNVAANGGTLSGTWSESTRGVSGSLEGRVSSGRFDVLVSSPTFTAKLRLTTSGNRQSVSISSGGPIRSVAISMNR